MNSLHLVHPHCLPKRSVYKQVKSFAWCEILDTPNACHNKSSYTLDVQCDTLEQFSPIGPYHVFINVSPRTDRARDVLTGSYILLMLNRYGAAHTSTLAQIQIQIQIQVQVQVQIQIQTVCLARFWAYRSSSEVSVLLLPPAISHAAHHSSNLTQSQYVSYTCDELEFVMLSLVSNLQFPLWLPINVPQIFKLKISHEAWKT